MNSTAAHDHVNLYVPKDGPLAGEIILMCDLCSEVIADISSGFGLDEMNGHAEDHAAGCLPRRLKNAT